VGSEIASGLWEKLANNFMKKFKNIFFLILIVGLGFLVAHLSVAQSSNKSSVASQNNLPEDDLQLLMDKLETTGQTNNLKLLFHGLDESRALTEAADISIVTAVLQGLRDGKTNEVINYLEGHLNTEIMSFGFDYGSLNDLERKQISLKSLQGAQDYRNKFPHYDPEFEKDVTNAFRFFDKSSH
jgi:hypothetical protein